MQEKNNRGVSAADQPDKHWLMDSEDHAETKAVSLYLLSISTVSQQEVGLEGWGSSDWWKTIVRTNMKLEQVHNKIHPGTFSSEPGTGVKYRLDQTKQAWTRSESDLAD